MSSERDTGTESNAGARSDPETEIEDSNPHAAGPQGLRGDMGLSSERTGTQSGIEGTGNTGTSATSTEGKLSPSDELDPATAHQPADGPEMDDTQQEATQAWRDEQPAAEPSTGAAADRTGYADDDPREAVDRTVGEPKPDDVSGQDFDPKRNPGHSHG